ncbi:integrase core domain-containing protein [Spirochaetota bacterium]
MKIIFNLIKSKKSLLIKIALLEKEVEILNRQRKFNLNLKLSDRVIFSIISIIGDIKKIISIVKPETVIRWQRNLIKKFWTFNSKPKRNGRPPIPHEIKQLILKIKNDNLYWGVRRIQGELLKLHVKLDSKTIWNILRDFRKKGKIKKSLTWKKFLMMQAESIYAMDFFTIDTILNQRYYILFIIHHKTREIVQYAITRNPTREFVKQQIIEFEIRVKDKVYMIRDRAPQFFLDYVNYGIIDVCTSVKAPNMNSIAERFVGSVRREALNYFIILNKKQLKNILSEYIEYYNSLRPHQGIEQRIPQGNTFKNAGVIKRKKVLGGIHSHYFREVA